MSIGNDTTKDDWVCEPCPTGTYSASASIRPFCSKKTSVKDCDGATQSFVSHSSSKQNDECVSKTVCPAGMQQDDNFHCVACAPGYYNPEETDSRNACIKKLFMITPFNCPKGSYLSLGTSRVIDDQRCSQCPFGQYQPDDDYNGIKCIAKSIPPTCAPGTKLSYGKSAVYDDNRCKLPNRIMGICVKVTKGRARSELGKLLIGMPKLVEPFTSKYTASIKTEGYSRVHKTGVVVVTGRRFVSGAERLPFPEVGQTFTPN